MANFRGCFDYSVDAKGRVNIPAKFRKVLSPEAEETFIITRGPNNCLRAYPKDAWERREAEMDARSETRDDLRHKRLNNFYQAESPLDAQGRVALTSFLMKEASIVKEVTLIGMSSYIELWDTAKFREYINSSDDFDEMFYKVEEEKSRV
jgi:MraZ protein